MQQLPIEPPDREVRVICHSRVALLAASLVLASCGQAGSEPPPSGREIRFPETAAVRVSPAGNGDWLLLFETLQPQYLVTSPIRSAAVLGSGGSIQRTLEAPSGWILIDAAAHPSGAVTLLTLRFDRALPYPLRVAVARVEAGGAVAQLELERIVLPGEAPPENILSLDRARLVARGEDVFALVRWANNSVVAYRLSVEAGTLLEDWATFVEPAARLPTIGIVGGGFDNFHQGDNATFVYADVDAHGNLVAGVPSGEDVLANHDQFFGDDLGAQADPASFDFGAAIVTTIDPAGARSSARLFGFSQPGKRKRLLNVRVAGDSVLLLGRLKTGTGPGSWDAWIHASSIATGAIDYERTIDVQDGDMFWDAAALAGGKLLAVGSTNYTQNPTGLSVSDARDALAVVLDAQGDVEQRIALPAGPANRGNEAISATVDANGVLAICGVTNAPGTHAEVYSDAFLVVRGAGLPE